MEGDDSTGNTEKRDSETAMELVQQANQEDGNLSSSDNDVDEFDVEMTMGSYTSSPRASQTSADEASSPLSPSQSFEFSEDDEDYDAEDRSHRGTSDEDSNNNHSDALSSFSYESDVEDNHDDDDDDDGPQSSPQVLKKTLPKQKFSVVKEIMNRQFQDNFKRKRAIEFGTKIYGSCKMVQRLELFGKLKKHTGCVNSIFFNDTGDILVSASDDRRVCLWRWANKKKLLHFQTGHRENVFQAKFLPNTNDTRLITCGADSQIRMMLLDETGFRRSELIVKHEKSVHKIALQRQTPNTFLSAGEDGSVYSIDVRESSYHPYKLLEIPTTPRKPNLPLYSIDCNPLKNHEFIVCGNDGAVRLYDQRRISSTHDSPARTFSPNRTNSGGAQSKSSKSATSAVYNYNGTEILASYNDNVIYLFDSSSPEEVEVHRYDGHRNLATSNQPSITQREGGKLPPPSNKCLKGVNFYGPRSEYVVSGSDCGYIYLWDKNSEAIVQWLRGDSSIVNCLEPHPSFPVLASSGMDYDVKIWMPTGAGDQYVRELPGFKRVTKKNVCYRGFHSLMIGMHQLGYDTSWSPLNDGRFNTLYGRIYERDSSNGSSEDDDEWLSSD